ncbi:S8 family serine peptidase [Streptomyces sp. NPDC090106]|uniref:S8 family serine peptidase n=1 Tax=Streptomyces sp. NPDC090106 TaxID=3365946 RepID=UPI00382D94F2
MTPDLDSRLPDRVYAHASPRSIGSTSLFDADQITVANATQFMSRENATDRAIDVLGQEGFEILGHSTTTLHIAGPPELYQDFFRTTLITSSQGVISPGAALPWGTYRYIDTPDTRRRGLIATERDDLRGFLEGVALEQPALLFSDIGPAPELPYWHLTLDQVAEHLGARALHDEGLTGDGVRLTMIDSGWEELPYFTEHKYAGTVVLGPQAANAHRDEEGHGTSESANAFSVAPGITFTMVKVGGANLVGAFEAALGQDELPDIISISLGFQAKRQLAADDLVLSAKIALAVLAGVTVVCASGNGHHAFPGQHPDVISVGGVHLDRNGEAEASDYASGYVSGVFPGRTVPDVSGLVGMQPGAAYIMLPAPPGSAIDRRRAVPDDEDGDGRPDWEGDGTLPDDGWIVASGTSAAAPQVAGVCALLKQAYPSLTPDGLRRALQKGARDVTRGVSNPATGGRAGDGPDDATGYGLARADEALRHLRRPRAASG